LTVIAQSARSLEMSPRRQGDSIVNGVRANEMVSLLEDLGYTCELNVEVAGMSGARHSFDILAQRDTTRLAVDFIQCRVSILDSAPSKRLAQEAAEDAAVKMVAKSFDCACESSFVVCLSSYLSSPCGEAFNGEAIGPNTRMIEAPDAKTAAGKIREALLTVETLR
jgi:hypothetical protein